MLPTRREVLASPALAYLLQALPSSAAPGSPPLRLPAAGDISRLCMVQDCTLLAFRYAKVPEETRAIFSKQLGFALLGHLVPSPEFLAGIGDKPEAKALALGARIDKAIGAELQTSRAGLSPQDAEECGLYQDVSVLRSTASPSKGAAVTDRQFLSLLKTIHRRLFIEIHTFEPDAENVEDWMDRLMRWNDDRELLISGYARVFGRPDAGKLRRFVEEPRFYDQADGLLGLISRARTGKAVVGDELHRLVSEEAPRSLYGRAVRAGLRALTT